MAFSWNEKKESALIFSKVWDDTHKENAYAIPFLSDFFNFFDISSRRIATFGEHVKKIDNTVVT
jgi:hypothetical protein